MLTLGHHHPELVRVVTEQLGLCTHGLDSPPLPEDTSTGANAVDATLELCRTATGRSDVVPSRGGFHGSGAAAVAPTGRVEQESPVADGVPMAVIRYDRREAGPGVDVSTRRLRRHGRQGPWSWAVRTTPNV